MDNFHNLKSLCKRYRSELFEKFLLLSQGHPGSVFSIIEIIVTLFYKNHIKFDKEKKKFIDKIIISKGHATSVLYPVLRDFGVIKDSDWQNWGTSKSNLRIFGNISITGIDATTGSLGHGLGIGCGMAYLYKKQNVNKKVFVLISEGELYEGSTWEALLFASHHKLCNLYIIIDENSLIILGKTSDCLKLDSISKKIEDFGFIIKECDGHNIDQIDIALSLKSDTAKVIVAKTIKGKGFSIMENRPEWHYWNSITKEQIEICRKDIS